MKQLFTYFAFFFGFFFAFGNDITCRPKVPIGGLTLPTATKSSHIYQWIEVEIPCPISEAREPSTVEVYLQLFSLWSIMSGSLLALPHDRLADRLWFHSGENAFFAFIELKRAPQKKWSRFVRFSSADVARCFCLTAVFVVALLHQEEAFLDLLPCRNLFPTLNTIHDYNSSQVPLLAHCISHSDNLRSPWVPFLANKHLPSKAVKYLC